MPSPARKISRFAWPAAMALLLCAAVPGLNVLRAHRGPMPPAHRAAPLPHLAIVTPPPGMFEQEQLMSPQALLARWDVYVLPAARRFHVPPDWIRAVLRQESGGRTVMDGDLPITSSTGAMGIMQVMPGTYDEMRAQYRLGSDPYDPHDNVVAGTAYLRWLHAKYGYPAMFAAYNDGPGNLEETLAGRHALPAETVAYLANIRGRLGDRQPVHLAAPTVQFTRPDGGSVMIAGLNAKSVRAVLPGEYPPGAESVIDLGKSRQAVREDVASATAALRLAGARL